MANAPTVAWTYGGFLESCSEIPTVFKEPKTGEAGRR
jgi:hypothetical protein